MILYRLCPGTTEYRYLAEQHMISVHLAHYRRRCGHMRASVQACRRGLHSLSHHDFDTAHFCLEDSAAIPHAQRDDLAMLRHCRYAGVCR